MKHLRRRSSNKSSENETIIKKKLKRNWFIEFLVSFLSVTNIHGLKYLNGGSHPLEVFFWIVVFGMASYGSILITNVTLQRYAKNPTVISMERDSLFWNTTFPGATICPTYQIDPKKFNEFVSKHQIQNETALRNFVLSLAGATYNNFDQVLPSYDVIPSEKYLDTLLELMFDYKLIASNSGSPLQEFKLQQTVTEVGICYTFNSQIAVYNSPWYWNTGKWRILDKTNIFYVHPLDGEIFLNIVNMTTPFDFYIHGPYETLDVASKRISERSGRFLQIYLSGLTIFSSDDVKYLTPEQRKCRFYDESNLAHFPVYSYVQCRMECRISLAKRLCGCIPHFYRKIDSDRICDVRGLHCLANNSERLIALKKECLCFSNCEEVNYVIEETASVDWFLGTNVQWGFREYPAMRLRRDVIFGFTDLLEYIGIITGLFYGCSVLSFIEMLYFFTLRLFWFVIGLKKK